ncbi:MAG: protein-glutamate O-methyltransferase CheR [bacterium]|nr:protein-glutamate O-methyltransferase CheR [bacterium]
MLFDFGDPKKIGKLTLEDFTVFRDLILEKSGIKIRDNRVDYLEYRVKERMLVNSLVDYREYYFKLKYDEAGPDSELQELINLVTVHETSFFRHPDQLDTLRDLVLKRIIEDKEKTGDTSLRMWSAVCATGEEPLTLAIMIKEHFPHLRHWSLSITASDISTAALDKAKKGVFGDNSFRAPLEDIKKRYFKKVDRHYHAVDEIKKMVAYRIVNLSDIDSLEKYRGMDLILCRNVFIYFPDVVKEAIARKFYDIMPRGGVLILGNAEVLDVKRIPFKLEFHRGGPVYTKV